MLKKLGSSLILAVALAGCEAMPDLAGRAVDFNEAAATAANQQVLLNAVRAYRREPMFYTRITGITTKRNVTPSLSLSMPFGADAREVFNGVTAGGASNETLFSTEILDAQEFYNGVMQPVSADILKFYLDAGWPQEMIFHLFVERFEVSEARFNDIKQRAEAECARGQAAASLCASIPDLNFAKPSAGRVYIDNDPRNREHFKLFQAFLRSLEALGLSMTSQMTERTVVYPKPVMASLEQLMKVTNARVEAQGDGVKVTFTERKSVFSFRDAALTAEVTGAGPDAITVTTRSADAALYYLGEVIEAQIESENDPEKMPSILTGFPDPKPAALFAVFKNGSPDDPPLEISYGGDSYAIPSPSWAPGGKLHGHRSMQVIALMNQVFALNKKGTAAPSVVPVTVLN